MSSLKDALKEREHALKMNKRLADLAFREGDYTQASEAEAAAILAERDIRRLKIEIELGFYI